MSKTSKILSLIVIVLVLMIGATAVQANRPAEYPSGPNYFLTGEMNYMGYNYPYNYYYPYGYVGIMDWENIIPSVWPPYSSNVSAPCCTNCNRAEFIRDVTIPDGSYVAPGSTFTKTWRIRNVSNVQWPAGTMLVFAGGSQLGAPAAATFPSVVSVGQTVDISVVMQAPAAAGTYQGNWMIQLPDSTKFGVGCNGQVPLWVSISTAVKSSGNYFGWNYGSNYNYNYNYLNSCATFGSCYTYTKNTNIKGINRNPYCNNKIRSVNDITISDGTEFAPGTSFRKTWTMKNGGTCVWNTGYSLVFTGGDGMGGVQSVPLPKKVYPGETVQISIDLKSPEIPGNYRGYYMLRDDLGYTFGFGSYANSAFWADIKVVDAAPPAATPAPSTETPVDGSVPAVNTPVPTTTNPTGPAPVVTTTPSVDPADQGVEEPLLMDSDGDPNYGADALEPSEMKSLPHNECGSQHIEVQFVEPDIYNISWFLTNSGYATWNPEKYRVVNAGISDNLVLIGADIALPMTKTGEQAMINISAKIRNTANSAENWLKFYINDGIESFCEVYFPLTK